MLDVVPPDVAGPAPGVIAAPPVPALPPVVQPTIGAQPVLPPPAVAPPVVPQTPLPPPIPASPAALATQDDRDLRDATDKQEKAQAAVAAADQAKADAVTAEKQRAADEHQARVDSYNADLEASRADVKAAQAKAANTPFHEFELSTTRQIIASLGMILGGASYDPNHVNQAVGLYQKAVEQDFAKQQAEHAKLLDGVKAAQEARRDLSAEQYHGLAELEKSQALKLEAVIAQSEKLASVSKNTLAIADLHAKNAQLRAASSEKLENSARLEAAARETERHNKAQEGIERGRLGLERARMNGAAGASNQSAQQEYIARLAAHPEWTPAQQILEGGKGLGLKVQGGETGKGGQPSLSSLRDEFVKQSKVGSGGGNGLPAVITDTLTGKDLPVDPKRTDTRKHNAAVAQLPQINGAIQILDKVLAEADKPAAPEALSYLGVDTSRQANLKGEMTRFRSAYAASKKESVGEANAKELAEAIPDPPSSFSSSASFNNWKKKIEATKQELHDTRNANLANAGVPPAYLDRAEAPTATIKRQLRDGTIAEYDQAGKRIK